MMRNTFAAILLLAATHGVCQDFDLSKRAADKYLAECRAEKKSAFDCYKSALFVTRTMCGAILRTMRAKEELGHDVAQERTRWNQCNDSPGTYLKPALDALVRQLAKKPEAIKAAKESWVAAKVAIEKLDALVGESRLTYNARIADQDRRVSEALARVEVEM